MPKVNTFARNSTRTRRRKAVAYARRSAQSGQAIAIIALAMIALLAFLILAIDGGKYLDQRRISQNASDTAALAGLYWYQHHTAPDNDNAHVLAAINDAAEKNGIPDANPPLGDATNANVKAWWINGAGQVLTSSGTPYADPSACPGGCEMDPAGVRPTVASGILVRTYIPYTTFIGQMVGQKDLRAQADGTALIFPGAASVPNPGNRNAVWTGGGSCNTATNPAFYWGGKVANNTDFGNGTTVNGWFRVDREPNPNWSKQNGTGDVVVVAGPNTAVDNNGNPLSQLAPEYTWKGPTSPEAQALTQNFPDSVYIKKGQLFAPNIPPRKLQIQAWHFRPDHATATLYGDTVDLGPTSEDFPASPPAAPYTNWIFQGHEMNISHGAPAGFFHYIKHSVGSALQIATDNGNDLVAMIAAGKTGIIFVDGDLTTSADWSGKAVTVVATGIVTINLSGGGPGGDPKLGSAGLYAWNFTILAGGTRSSIPPSNPDQDCATPANSGSNYVLHFNGQQSGWAGIIYVPNGLFWIDTNWHSSEDPMGPIIAWSQATALTGGNPADNFQFSKCGAECFPQPTYQMGLQQ